MSNSASSLKDDDDECIVFDPPESEDIKPGQLVIGTVSQLGDDLDPQASLGVYEGLSVDEDPDVHQGPAPIFPPPPSPQISAEELSMLTEALANRNGMYQCTLCSKQFGYKNGLVRHVRLTHVGEKPYQCTICNRRFGYKHILMEHQNLHFGNRPYACNQCDKRFAARSNLVQHRTVHRRPFHCHLCPKRFEKDEQLNKHLFAHPPALHGCRMCGFSCHDDGALSRHVLENHSMCGNPVQRPCLFRGVSRDHDEASGSSCQRSEGSSLHDDVVIKTETVESNESSLGDSDNCTRDSGAHVVQSPRLCAAMSQQMIDSSNHSAAAAVAAAAYSQFLDQLTSGGKAAAGKSQSHSNNPAETYSTAATGILVSLSGPPQLQSLPSFSNFAPRQNNPTSIVTEMGSRSTTSDQGPTGHRPTAQLPPITHSLRIRENTTAAAATTASPAASSEVQTASAENNLPTISAVSAMPPLEEVLEHYISRGNLFKCAHCNILFHERGMYFLHSSLHGSTPWECSICHKLCADKNEFTLHFVNQQHSS